MSNENEPILNFDEPEIKLEELIEATHEIIHGEADNNLVEDQIVEQNQQNDTQENIEEHSELETKARAKGWRPKSEFSGDKNSFIDAKEFLERNELYEKIHGQNQAIKRLEKTITEFAEVNKRQQEMLAKEKSDYYLNQKRQAIENGNIEDAEKFEKAYYESQVPLYGSKQDNRNVEISPAAKDFARRNMSWFNNDTPENQRMKILAIEKEEILMNLYPDWSDEKRLLETEYAVKEAYPHRFENKNRNSPPRVNINQPENMAAKKTGRKVTFNSLPSSYKAIVRVMAKYGNLDLDDYAQQLYDTGVIKNG